MATEKLTKRLIDGLLPLERRYAVWDADVTGLGVRVSPKGPRHPNGRKIFVLYYRTVAGVERRPTLGTFGEMTVEQARQEARDILAKVRLGADPSAERQSARDAPTVNDVCDRYLAEHARPHKKSSSTRKDEQNLRLHVRPRWGSRKIQSIDLEDVQRMHHDMRETSGAANRVLALFSKICNLCEAWGLRSQHSNPCRHVKKYKEKKIHNSISEIEIARLAKVLREAEEAHARVSDGRPRDTDADLAENPNAVAALRLLVFTGCRREEVLKLRWDEVRADRHRLELADSKSGEKHVTLNTAAEEVIAAQKTRRIVGNEYVFPGLRKGRPLVGLPRIWYRLRKRAGLGEAIRIHDFRHAFGEIAAGSNLSLHMIGRLLGHTVPATTARYAKFADDPTRRAAEQIGETITKAMAKDTEST
jgi:integrase